MLGLAEKNGLAAQRQKLLAQIVSDFRHDIELNPDPKAWRTYWPSRAAEAPGKFNFTAWLTKEAQVENWTAAQALSQRIIDLSADHQYAWYQKAYTLRQLLLRPDEVLISVRAEPVEASANPSTGSGRTVQISKGRINR